MAELKNHHAKVQEASGGFSSFLEKKGLPATKRRLFRLYGNYYAPNEYC